VSDAWGLEFRHHHGGSGELYMVETMGSGVAVFDYDGDGDQDVFFVDSGELPGYEGEEPGSVLFRNDGGRFVDVTERAGLRVDSYGMGATAGDADGDGDLDLYVTAFGPNRLFVNRGDGTFEDVTERAGVGDPRVGASAAFADVDRDGDLDLYVTNYVDFSLENNPTCGNESRGIRTYCHPDAFDGVPDVFYRNAGSGPGGPRFEDATADAGFGGADGKGLGVLFSDLDQDGWPDLYVANDMTPNFLFRNRGRDPETGRVTFEDVALLSGTALSDRGDPEASMGLDLGDLDGDGGPELIATHMDDQTNALYGASAPFLFADRRWVSKLAEPSVGKVGFGVAFADFDHDRDLDVAVANGHIIHNIERFKDSTTYAQRNQVFENVGRGRFREVTGSGMDAVRVSRGLAVGDLDGDGDLDVAVNNSNDRAEVYENLSGAGRWLQVDLAAPEGNRFGIGARVTLEAGGSAQWREVRTASSYLSQNALTVHFGLGDAEVVENLRVRWPDGAVQVVRGLPADRRVRVHR
ncbi:MAG: CRTAC1 family protein, partial [Acidobacteriota bacterium]